MTAPQRDLLAEDYHVHSTFSDDAVSSLRENIAAAADRGLRVVRLTEHVRSSTTWVADFVAAVAAEPVPRGLTVLTGVEAKILDSTGALDVPDDLSGIDGIVMADHQFPGPDGPWTPAETQTR
ncbi:MAG: PHP domain-containing protein, partial [Rhodoglobus sp.]